MVLIGALSATSKAVLEFSMFEARPLEGTLARFRPGQPVVTDETLCPPLCPLGNGGKFPYYQVFCSSREGFHT